MGKDATLKEMTYMTTVLLQALAGALLGVRPSKLEVTMRNFQVWKLQKREFPVAVTRSLGSVCT